MLRIARNFSSRTRRCIVAERKTFADSITPLPAAEGLTPHGLMIAAAPADQSKERMTILFSLAVPKDDEEELRQLVAQGKSLPPEEVAKKCAANSTDSKAVVKCLKYDGFKVEEVSDYRTCVYASAPGS